MSGFDVGPLDMYQVPPGLESHGFVYFRLRGLHESGLQGARQHAIGLRAVVIFRRKVTAIMSWYLMIVMSWMTRRQGLPLSNILIVKMIPKRIYG